MKDKHGFNVGIAYTRRGELALILKHLSEK